MTQETKPNVFEFDPLPSDKPESPIVDEAPTKRGRKPKAEKKERKKRGPRRVQTATEPLGATLAVDDGRRATVADLALPLKKTRKPRKHHGGKSTPVEYEIIGQIMLLSMAQRRRVLAALNKVFG